MIRGSTSTLAFPTLRSRVSGYPCTVLTSVASLCRAFVLCLTWRVIAASCARSSASSGCCDLGHGPQARLTDPQVLCEALHDLGRRRLAPAARAPALMVPVGPGGE